MTDDFPITPYDRAADEWRAATCPRTTVTLLGASWARSAAAFDSSVPTWADLTSCKPLPLDVGEPTTAPQRDGSRDHTITLKISIPTYGKPDQDMATAAEALKALQLSLRSDLTAEMWMPPHPLAAGDWGSWVPVVQRKWERVH